MSNDQPKPRDVIDRLIDGEDVKVLSNWDLLAIGRWAIDPRSGVCAWQCRMLQLLIERARHA
jgi:hypothetical protein